jgi:hypothetical protein
MTFDGIDVIQTKEPASHLPMGRVKNDSRVVESVSHLTFLDSGTRLLGRGPRYGVKACTTNIVVIETAQCVSWIDSACCGRDWAMANFLEHFNIVRWAYDTARFDGVDGL